MVCQPCGREDNKAGPPKEVVQRRGHSRKLERKITWNLNLSNALIMKRA